jgi:hypothetical protein
MKNLIQTNGTTTEPVRSGDCTGTTPEFGRCADVQRIFGLRRGTLYNLLLDGKIKGVLLRVRGKKSGVRLFEMDSVRQFIRAQMEK